MAGILEDVERYCVNKLDTLQSSCFNAFRVAPSAMYFEAIQYVPFMLNNSIS
jgi:hypothetical protein